MPNMEDASLVQQEEPSPTEARRPVQEKEEFDRLLNSYSQFSQPPIGSLLRGHVVKIAGSEVIVDVGYKCEGVISAEEFKDAEGKLRLQPGDEIEVMMESTEEREGYVVLSRERAKRLKAWEDIESAYERQSVVPARVLERIKGGLAVDIGVRAFLPGSQVDVKPVRNLDALIGEEISCKIIKLNKKRSNIVVSRKAVLETEHLRRKERTLAQLREGAVVTGTVKNITDYGVFVDLGGIDGLLHITDLSWGRVSHPSEAVSVGDELQVKVLKFDPEKERVSLGLKQLSEDPWLTVAERFPVGARVSGKVLNVADYGAFVELAQGIEGLIHVSEMSWSKRIKHPSKIVSPGSTVETVVLDIHPSDRRISLGLKQTEANPWETLPQRYAIGTKIRGRVRNLTDFGAFVEVEEGIDGLVHVSDISWTRRIKHPSEVLKKGQMVEAAILNIDPENRRLSLGIKQLQQNAWDSFCSRCKAGDVLRGKVVRKASFGLFVELAEGIEGLCHISEITSDPVDKNSLPMEIGQECDFKIIKVSPAERKVGLSLKALEEKSARQERPEREKFIPPHSASSATNTIEEMVAMKERNLSKK
jgi:small subunit ribosomal protein S1